MRVQHSTAVVLLTILAGVAIAYRQVTCRSSIEGVLRTIQSGMQVKHNIHVSLLTVAGWLACVPQDTRPACKSSIAVVLLTVPGRFACVPQDELLVISH
jgi:hypothetical protein